MERDFLAKKRLTSTALLKIKSLQEQIGHSIKIISRLEADKSQKNLSDQKQHDLEKEKAFLKASCQSLQNEQERYKNELIVICV
jgi:hypothetical protein